MKRRENNDEAERNNSEGKETKRAKELEFKEGREKKREYTE